MGNTVKKQILNTREFLWVWRQAELDDSEPAPDTDEDRARITRILRDAEARGEIRSSKTEILTLTI